MVLFLRSVESILWRSCALLTAVLFRLFRPISGANAKSFSNCNAGNVSHVGRSFPLKYIQRRLLGCGYPSPQRLTSGSSRSLRSLGLAEASPLTKR